MTVMRQLEQALRTINAHGTNVMQTLRNEPGATRPTDDVLRELEATKPRVRQWVVNESRAPAAFARTIARMTSRDHTPSASVVARDQIGDERSTDLSHQVACIDAAIAFAQDVCKVLRLDVFAEAAMCYVHKLMQCACQDGDAGSGKKTAQCRSWKCEVQKAAKPDGANGAVLCRDKVMSA